MEVGRCIRGGAAAAVLVLAMGAVGAQAQTGSNHGSASDQDKHFLEEIAKDSNFEIKTSQLALHKSQSADVKQYATMVLHDHERLTQQIHTADTAARTSPVSAGSMTVADHAVVTELNLLSGNSFDNTCIKHLVKGNEEIQNDEKSEALNSTIRQVKTLAEHSAALDTKHSDKAKQLAQAHNIQP